MSEFWFPLEAPPAFAFVKHHANSATLTTLRPGQVYWTSPEEVLVMSTDEPLDRIAGAISED